MVKKAVDLRLKWTAITVQSQGARYSEELLYINQ
uniref:Uncharacterized protein n=1 Tax=Anguilla anguilla TaxID=7936 RepID=A0A0E9UE38_ANGAN